MFEHFKAASPELADQWDTFAGLWKRLEVPAGKILLREGEVSQKAYLVEQGCLRLWFSRGKKDITFQFFFENEIVSSMESFRKNIPSLYTLEAIEPCVLLALRKEDFVTIMAQVRRSPEALHRMLEAAYDRQAHYMNHFMSFIRDKPEERYRNLVKENPRLIQRVAQRYIASYLGITPVSLSRIRARR